MARLKSAVMTAPSSCWMGPTPHPQILLARLLISLTTRSKRIMTQTHATKAPSAPRPASHPAARRGHPSRAVNANEMTARIHHSPPSGMNRLSKLSPRCRQESHTATFLKTSNGPHSRSTATPLRPQTWQPSLIVGLPACPCRGDSASRPLLGGAWFDPFGELRASFAHHKTPRPYRPLSTMKEMRSAVRTE